MKIWVISDTHGLHEQLIIPENIDMIIHAGDATNSSIGARNAEEFNDFWYWFANLPIKHKIFSPGNHDVAIERGLVKPDSNICHIHETVVIEGLKIFCSPYTPTFGSYWAFNKDRAKLAPLWEDIEYSTDIVVTHGPPKGILDLSTNINGDLEFCGDKSLYNRVMKIAPAFHVFGHIHNGRHGELNQGKRLWKNTTFVNASCVTDGAWLNMTSNGVILNI